MEQEATHDVEIVLQQLQETSHIWDIMDINQFLNPVEENIKDSLDHINEQILAKYGKDIEAESDKEDEVYIKISHNEALLAI